MDALDALLDLLLPTPCRGCGTGRAQLCPGCRAALEHPPRQVAPDPAPPGLPPLYAAAAYGGPVRNLLLAHKERGALRLSAPLGRALARAVHAATAHAATAHAVTHPATRCLPAAHRCPRPALLGPALLGPVLLVPVPSARRALRSRGHDPVGRLAGHAAAALRLAGLPACPAAALRPVRAVADQVGLGAADRRRNLAGALAVRPGAAAALRRRRVVLVDDLVTTGATLAEATRAVTAAGAHVLAGATVAATLRRTPQARTPQAR